MWANGSIFASGKGGAIMSNRIDPSWLVFDSVENFEHNRCVDLFSRPDGTFGFEEFRRDTEDMGKWTPVQFYSVKSFPSQETALSAAVRAVVWLDDAIETRRLPHSR
jgi:hypothetical protein